MRATTDAASRYIAPSRSTSRPDSHSAVASTAQPRMTSPCAATRRRWNAGATTGRWRRWSSLPQVITPLPTNSRAASMNGPPLSNACCSAASTRIAASAPVTRKHCLRPSSSPTTGPESRARSMNPSGSRNNLAACPSTGKAPGSGSRPL
ncbi:hypothetical protein J2S66_002756 [Saccharothrix longispora]|uniref:Uncharacterized protein n=1 Tax=Saccharothrix longispora TaxID=33920 RepID=A0ABU1PUP7_9PSEU|nr:hypothetical protein [Saccharothrix longispora]MDR6594372.1 hypothetical protein [Saccharothrix longispora]